LAELRAAVRAVERGEAAPWGEARDARQVAEAAAGTEGDRLSASPVAPSAPAGGRPAERPRTGRPLGGRRGSGSRGGFGSRAGSGSRGGPGSAGDDEAAEESGGLRPGGGRGGAAAGRDADRDPVDAARNICLRLLTGAPRTRGQLAEALAKREVPEEVAERVLSRLADVGLIDDAAFAEAWVDSRHRDRGLARRALARELRTRGVADAVVAEAVARVEPEQEEERARALVERKLPASRGLARDTRIRRLVGMLARRGYPEGMAFRVVRAALDAEPDLDDPQDDSDAFGPFDPAD